MREIKFRAYDSANKVMEYNVNVNQGKPVKQGYQWFDSGNTVYHSDLMQYTGLKDRNGKEIYEGDIVETELGKGVVVFDSGSFLINILEDDEYYGFEDFFSLHEEGGCYLVEVIGNIFQGEDYRKEV